MAMKLRSGISDNFVEECSIYDSRRSDLERDHMGEYVLIQRDGLVAIFPTLQSARENAKMRFPHGPYLISRIVEGFSPSDKGEWNFTNA